MMQCMYDAMHMQIPCTIVVDFAIMPLQQSLNHAGNQTGCWLTCILGWATMLFKYV